MARVVVGLDVSPQSREALRIATHEARWRSATLEAVHVFQVGEVEDIDPLAGAAAMSAPTAAGGAPAGSATREAFQRTTQQIDEARQEAKSRLQRIVGEAGDALNGVSVEYTVITDQHPAEALVKLSENADLLVVGSRGLGGFKGLLLGSVSLQCVLYATVPVLVVRPRLHGSPVQ